jgi:hypothetical protein
MMRRLAFWRRCTCVRLLSAPGLMTRYVSPDCPRHGGSVAVLHDQLQSTEAIADAWGKENERFREVLERIAQPAGIVTVDDLCEIASDALREGSP